MHLFPHCRIVVDLQPNSGDWNMAVDEVLLESADQRNECSLRFYQWSEATVSLGYFQKRDEAALTPELVDLPIVRRLSGGGAILHHHELTYSCAVPASHKIAAMPHQLYDLIHEQIIGVLSRQGIHTEMRGSSNLKKSGDFHSEPFLCFGRGDQRDIVLDGHKVVGSAQRRRRGSILQHGSILMQKSPYAAQFPGIMNLAPEATSLEKLQSMLIAEIGRSLAENVESSQLSQHEFDRADTLRQMRYASLDFDKQSCRI